ncbi:hypothetical protein [Hymenobacter cellulosilyticus]|uniref:Uncharacterized protein n=1 Tax=Hymenobacter cellulosilyticus TaxID=2932248 RepID=A0A8T9Q380_9BACT|nr:hypothetical protein [Hymenobacter cellulosilyticus]UOQ70250.1 hypothetical protein MUN79_15975 [Hymenobacter cellulosilyticus]
MLLLLFVYNLVGFYPAYTWRQHQFRQQAEQQRRAQLPDDALVQIRVARHEAPGTALQWQEQHEFRWRGKLYDVVRQHADADSITYFCWHDQGEEKLLAGLQKHVEQISHPSASAGKTAKKLFDHLFKLAFLPPPSQQAPAVVLPDPLRQYRPWRAATLHPVAAVVVPPPEPGRATA